MLKNREEQHLLYAGDDGDEVRCFMSKDSGNLIMCWWIKSCFGDWELLVSSSVPKGALDALTSYLTNKAPT